MKTKKTISQLVATAAMAVASIVPSFAQNNLGAACGCPLVSARTTVTNLSSIADVNGELNATATVLDCATIWVLDRKIYVGAGKSLTIQPGTLIKGDTAIGGPVNATALVVNRGAKIYAAGTAECPIVFTAKADPMNNTYGVSNRGKWGGVVVLGNGITNLTLANATAANAPGGTCVGSSCFGTGVGTGFIEGFTVADVRNQYGGNDNADNSGVLKYISIRHAGAKINTNGNELNGLTLGAVGNGTIIENIDIIANDDDGIEWFGGAVNVKNISVLFSNDDMFDWDQGWVGNAQFLFGIQLNDNLNSPAADNGFEMDSDDQKTSATPLSRPTIYNATLIGDGDANQNTSDNSAHAAINAKEYTGGLIYNSIFANFETGLNMQKTFVAPRTGEAYVNWTPGTDLQVGCNTFINMAQAIRTSKSKTSDGAAALSTDLTKFSVTDKNDTVASVAGFDFVVAFSNPTTNVVSDEFDAIPNPALATTCATPTSNFFTYAPYKGAFSSTQKNWLSDWSYTTLIDVTNGLVACPTDVNKDGSTTNSDLSQILINFGQSCK